MTSPSEVGLDETLPERLRMLADRHLETGVTQAMQLHVSRHGLVVVDEAVGTADRDTRFFLASASKAITIVAFHLVVERGLVAYNDPVCRHVEEFGRNGKEAVTVRQLLTHRGGFPDLGMTTVATALAGDWEATVDAVCSLPLEHEPDTLVVYHGFTASLVLAEIVRRVDGRDFRTFCEEEIFVPLGMRHTSWGLPEGPPVADLVGHDAATDADVAVWRSPIARTPVLPGANAHSTARDLAALYESIRPGGTGRRLLSPATVEHAIRLHAPVLPGAAFGFGYGFMVGTDPALSLSRGNLGSPRSFGHPGMTFTQALCDPADGLVMVFLSNVALTQAESDRRFGIYCDTVHRAVLDRAVT